jgi:hypothetical protein
LTVILSLAELHEQEQRGGGDPETTEKRPPVAVAMAVERCYAITRPLLETWAE